MKEESITTSDVIMSDALSLRRQGPCDCHLRERQSLLLTDLQPLCLIQRASVIDVETCACYCCHQRSFHTEASWVQKETIFACLVFPLAQSHTLLRNLILL